MKTGIVAAGLLALAAGGVLIYGLHGDSPSALLDSSGRLGDVRQAILETSCVQGHPEDRKSCVDIRVKGEIMLCATESKAELRCEIQKDDVEASAKKDLILCSDAKGRTSVLEVGSGEVLKPDCQVVAAGQIETDSLGYETGLTKALAEKCGWPVYPLDWGCCPHCLAYKDGCPPCRALCKYGDKWRGYEIECNEEK